MYEDEDNDGRFPDESPVEVRHLRSKQEEQGQRGGPDDPFHDGGRGLRPGRLRGGGFSPPYLRPGPGPRAGRHGGPDAAAERGRIIAASLVLLHEARNDRDAPGLARFMLWLGISAFVGAVEIAMQVVRRLPGHAQERARTAPCRDCDAATVAVRLVRAWRGFSGIVTWPRAQHPGLAGAVRGNVAGMGRGA